MEMWVNISLGDEMTETVPVDAHSGFLYTMVQDMGNNIIIPFPTQHSSIAVEYIAFLKGRDLTLNKNNFIDLFRLYYLFGDNNLFNYLISKLLNLWSELSLNIWSLNPELLEEILFHCPHQMLPKEYISNTIFFGKWKKINVNRKITLNSTEQYEYKITNHGIIEITKFVYILDNYIDNKEEYYSHGQIKRRKIYETNSRDNSCLRTEQTWYENGNQKMKDDCFAPDTGTICTWYDNGQMESLQLFTNGGISNGVWKTWYKDGKLKTITNYEHRDKNGSYEEWDKEGNLREKGNFFRDKKNGIWEKTFHNKQVEKLEYKMGKKHGIYEKWNLDYGSLETGTYDNGMMHGQWTTHTIQNKQKVLKEQGKYNNNLKEGMWQERSHNNELVMRHYRFGI